MGRYGCIAHEFTPYMGGMMREKRLNAIAVVRCLRSVEPRDAPSVSTGSDTPQSPARRRFLWQSAALGASPAFANSRSAENLSARRTASGFAFLYRGQVIWTADVRWQANPLSCRMTSGPGYAEVSLPQASLPGMPMPCAFRARLARVDDRFVIAIDHALGEERQAVDLDAWLDGSARLPLGKVTLPSDLGLTPLVSVAKDQIVHGYLMPDLSFRFRSEAGFSVHGRELDGTFDECEIAPATDAASRLIPNSSARAIHVTLSAETSAGAKVRPRLTGNKWQCAVFRTSQLRFELSELTPGAIAFGWLASAQTPVALRTSTPRWIDEPRVTLLAQELSFGRVVSDAPASLLVATTSQVTLHADDLALSGECVDCDPLMIADHDASQDLRRSVVWTHGALRDSDGISVQLHFQKGTTPVRPEAITQLLDDIPWHRKRISLAGVVIEFARPEDGLWLRASLDGFELAREAGRYKVLLDGTRRLNDATDPPLLHLRLPPQSFSEQAFYRAPDDSGKDWPPLPRQSQYADLNAMKRQGVTDTALAITIRTRAVPKDGSEPIPNALSALRVAGDSVLRFTLRDGQRRAFELSLGALLDSQRWQFRVAPQARTATSVDGEATLNNVTDIELPWRVHLSPDDQTQMASSPQRLPDDTSFNPLFFLRPYALPPAQNTSTPAALKVVDLPLRAIASPDHGVVPWLHFGATKAVGSTRLPQDPVRTALDEQDRNELVWLSGRWGQPALEGTANVQAGVYTPQPIKAQRLLLTAFGGSMRSTGHWDPPSLKFEGRTDGITQVAMTIEEWDHASTLGRSHLDRVIYRGYLLPIGFRVALIKMTTREVEWHPQRGYLAVPVQRYFIRTEEPIKVFPCAVGQPLASLNGFFQPERFELKLDHDLQISNPAANDIAGMGQDAFWVCTPTAAKDHTFPFSLRIGNDGIGTMPMAFVSNRVVHDPGEMDSVRKEFNKNGATLTTRSAKITFAPSIRQGDTRFTTHTAVIKTVVNDTLINSALLESHHQPPFFPVLGVAEIELDAIQRATQQKTPQISSVCYAQLYQAIGFGDAVTTQPPTRAGQATSGTPPRQGNPAEVFLTLNDPVSMRFSGNGERSGGVATPNMTANALSRSKGLISGFVDLAQTQAPTASIPVQKALRRIRLPAAPDAGALAPTSTQVGGFDNPFATDAKLLGIIPLREVFKIVGLDDLPAFVESIDETIAAQATNAAAQLSTFGAIVRDAADRLEQTLQTQTAFVQTAEGAKLATDLKAIDANAANLVESQAPLPDRLQASMALAAQLRGLDISLRTVAAHPESLLHLQAIEDIKTKLVAPLEDAAKKASDDAQNHLAQACADANQQVADLIGQLHDEASQAYAAVADRFADQVLEYAATHRNELIAVQASATQVSDVLAQLRWLSQCYRDYYARGFGLPDVVQQFMDSAPTRDVANALNQVKARIKAIQQTPTIWQTLCQDAIDTGMALEDAWNRQKLEFPVEAKACAAPFAALSRHLHELVADGHADEVTDEMPLAPFNRAHQVLMETIAALEQAPARLGLLADAGVIRGQADLRNAVKGLASSIDGLVKDLTTLKKALTENTWRPLVSSILEHYVEQTSDALNVASDTTTDATSAALGICEALGNLFDLRLAGNDPAVSATHTRLAANSTAEQVRLAIIAIETQLRKIAQIAWRGIDLVLAAIAAAPEPADELKDLVGEKLIDATKSVIQDASKIHKDYQAALNVPDGPDSATLLDLDAELGGLLDEINDWVRLMQQLPAQIEARALDILRNEVQALLASIVPAKITANLEVKRDIEDYDNIFVAHHGDNAAQLSLSAHVETDLIARSTASSFHGALTNFEINLFDMVVLGVTRLAFSADNGKMHLESPQIDGVTINSPLDFLNGLADWMNGSNGPFVMPLPNGVKAGYRMSGTDIPIGPLLVLNFSFEAAVELPFDDRAAIFSVAVGSKDDPCLVSVPPYGGGMFFEMQMAGSRLVALSAAVEYGLMGAFDSGVVKGVGRVVVGIYIMQNAQGGLLQGYFYAGGYARILGIISVTVDLRISLTYSTTGRVDGAGRFSVSIGVGPFSWTLTYTVEYQSKKASAIQANDVGALAQPASTPDVQDDGPTPVDLRNGQRWKDYRAAFALGDIYANKES